MLMRVNRLAMTTKAGGAVGRGIADRGRRGDDGESRVAAADRALDVVKANLKNVGKNMDCRYDMI